MVLIGALTFDVNSWQNLAGGIEFSTRQGGSDLILNPAYDSHPRVLCQGTDKPNH